jgi:hypothetical protein
MEPVPIDENRRHGAYLRWFYKEMNLQNGDAFLVPIRNSKVKVPVYRPILDPVPRKNPLIKLTQPIPAPDPIFPFYIPGLGPVLIPVF